MTEEKARRQAEERQAVADGGAAAPVDDGGLRDEAAYTTEGEQGAAQPSPG